MTDKNLFSDQDIYSILNSFFCDYKLSGERWMQFEEIVQWWEKNKKQYINETDSAD